MTAEETLKWLQDHPEVESLRVAICDLNGSLRGKGIPASQAKKALQGEVRIPLSAAGVDVWGEDIVGSEMVFESGDVAIAENDAGQFELNLLHVADPLRVGGADANPYLVLAAVLGAPLEGIQHEVSPPPAVVGEAYQQATEYLPIDWASAIEGFENGPYMQRIFAPVLRNMLVSCKRQELSVFARHVTDFEYHSYLEIV